MPEYFFDFVGGLSTNDGLTITTPKKSDADIIGLVLAGNTLRLKRGVIWPRSGLYGDVVLDIAANLASVCTIKDYGDAVNPPILDNFTYDNTDANWTHVASGRWTRPYAAGAVSRVLIGGSAAALTIGGLAWKGSSLTDVTRPFWWDANVLHVFTGSTTVAPPTFYSGLAIIGNNSSTGIRFRGAKNLLVQNIRSIGAQLAGFLFDTAAVETTDLQLDDCEVLYPGYQSGFRIRSSAAGLLNRRITLLRPVVNLKTDASENEGSSVRVGGSDGINITHNFDQITVTDPTITRTRHAGINCYEEATYTPGIVNISAGKNYGVFDMTLIEYGRGLNLIGYSGVLDIKCSGIKTTGQVTQTQLAGKVRLSGCSWKQNRFDNVIQGFESSHVVSISTWDAGPGDARMVDVVVQNNLIEHPRSSAIVFRRGSVAVYGVDKVRVYNNTIVDVTYYGENSHKAFTTIDGGFGSVDNQLIRNNNVITPSLGANHVLWNGVASTINATTLGFVGNAENFEGYSNRTAGDYTILRSGACYRSGAVGVSGLLDLDGLAFDATPSIGPLASVTAAPPTLGQGLLYNDNGELVLVLGPAPGSALKGQGWARDASGSGYYLLAPQTIAYRHQGRTYTADGSLIVTTGATSVSDSIWQGVRTRADGATYVKSVGAGYVLG